MLPVADGLYLKTIYKTDTTQVHETNNKWRILWCKSDIRCTFGSRSIRNFIFTFLKMSQIK